MTINRKSSENGIPKIQSNLSKFKIQFIKMEEERQPTDKKKTYNHVMKAKLYGVMAVNTIEGISWEIDNLLPSEYEKGISLIDFAANI